jgi:mRNA interferase MazF
LDTDVSVPESDFTGLRVPSTLRLHRLMTVSTSMILRELGRVLSEIQDLAERKLRKLFGLA